MNETERKTYLEQFNRRTHVLGRIVSAITLVLLVGAPFLIGTFLGAMPDMGASPRAFCPSARVDGQQRGGVSHLHAHARRRRRLPRLHHRQPHQYEDPVCRQRTRYRRHEDRHGRKRDHLDALDRNILACDHRRARARRGAARTAAARAAEPRAPAGVCQRRPGTLRRDGVSVFPQERAGRGRPAGRDEPAVHARPVADGLDQLHDRSERCAGHRHRYALYRKQNQEDKA